MTIHVFAARVHHLSRSRSSSRLACALLVATLASSGLGCTTTQHLYPHSAAPNNALAGAHVTVLTHDGQSVEMGVVESSGEHLAGNDSSGQRQVFQLTDVRSIEVTEFSGGKTALLTMGIVSAALAIAFTSTFDMSPVYLQ